MSELNKDRIFQIIFFIIFGLAILFSVFDINNNLGTILPRIKIVSNQTQTIKIADDIFINLQYNGSFEKFYSSNISKDEDKIILIDCDDAENRQYFDYQLEQIQTPSDILPVMLKKTGYLLNSYLTEEQQLDELTIFNERKILTEELVLNKYIGVIKDINQKEYKFICYSFIKNEVPCYLMAVDLTVEQSLDLTKYLISEE